MPGAKDTMEADTARLILFRDLAQPGRRQRSWVDMTRALALVWSSKRHNMTCLNTVRRTRDFLRCGDIVPGSVCNHVSRGGLQSLYVTRICIGSSLDGALRRGAVLLRSFLCCVCVSR